jgi:hypothetical protein
VGLVELDVGRAGQLVGAKLGGVGFVGGAASLTGRGRWFDSGRGEVSAGEGAVVYNGF